VALARQKCRWPSVTARAKLPGVTKRMRKLIDEVIDALPWIAKHWGRARRRRFMKYRRPSA